MRSGADFAAAVRRGRRVVRPTVVMHYRVGTASARPDHGGRVAPSASTPVPTSGPSPLPTSTPGSGSVPDSAGAHAAGAHAAGAPGAGAAPPALVGFVVSRAVGGSVTRNRVKRRLRHMISAHLNGLPAGSLLVVRATPAAAVARERVSADVESALAAVRPR